MFHRAQLLKYELLNVMRGRWIFLYGLLFTTALEALLRLGNDPGKIAASMMSLVLLVVPMVSILYATVYSYNADGFTSLILTQPVRRSHLFLSRWIAISAALGLSFLVGTLIPLVQEGALGGPSLLLLVTGVALTLIFAGMGILVSVVITDRMRGIGGALLLWFYFAVVHDGLLFLLLAQFHEYPTEVPAMILTALSPIDLSRVLMLTVLDVTALMGYTGTILQEALSGALGYGLLGLGFLVWGAVPVLLGGFLFERGDL